MTTQRRKSFRAIAVFLAVAFFQVCVQLSFAAPASAAAPQQFIARLTSTGAVTVNNASASSGASILTGSTIETPAATSATIDLGALGTIEMPPGSSIQLDFADDGTVRVKVLNGCVRIHKKGPGEAEAYTAEGASEKTNSNRKSLGFCFANGALNPIDAALPATAAGGSSNALWWVIGLTLAGTVGGLAWGLRGDNNSP